ncbi:MAG: bifunctional adenosylcobinamide kinase/adenosylcobinamide-phosphate guanylyltransferase [Desulfovibrionaceae bacterium]
MIRLILGGDKSGKSDLALQIFQQGPAPRCLLATGRAQDFGLRDQILDHRRRRTPDIPVRETGARLARELADLAAEGVRSILVDSLDFWLFTVAGADQEQTAVDAAVGELLDVLASLAGDDAPVVTVVSCEAGLGPIPANAATRAFVRGLGALNQAVASHSREVRLVVAGLPLPLKG